MLTEYINYLRFRLCDIAVSNQALEQELYMARDRIAQWYLAWVQPP
jgi:hypothetical protein